MKKRLLNFKPLIYLAFLPYIGMAGLVSAADFFPLDIWVEMVVWQSKKSGSYAIGPKARPAPQSSFPDAAGKATEAFPWDVRAELNSLGSDKRYEAFRFLVKIDAANRNRTNPYWRPEEFRWGPSPGAVPVDVADYLTNAR